MATTLHHGDCLDILPTLPAQSVDAIIADPPYGTTACKWDSVIPLEAMWRELKRVVKPRGAVVLFASQPFTSVLIGSNLDWFKYELIWQKERTGAPGVAQYRPLPIHESIAVFGDGRTTYNPIMAEGAPYRVASTAGGKDHKFGFTGKAFVRVNDGERFPTSVLPFQTKRHNEHPTEKPLDLMRYLVQTYTNPGETVLDFTMGSGTTGVACAMEGRHFIGVELDAGYYEIATRRIESVQPALMEAAD